MASRPQILKFTNEGKLVARRLRSHIASPSSPLTRLCTQMVSGLGKLPQLQDELTLVD